MESPEHLFLNCPLTTSIWLCLVWQFRIDGFWSWKTEDWVKYLVSKYANSFLLVGREFEFLNFATVLMETIWLFHNKVVHGELILELHEIGCLIQKKSAEYFHNAHSKSSARKLKDFTILQLSPTGWLKFNFDASFYPKWHACSSCLLMDNEGSIFYAWNRE